MIIITYITHNNYILIYYIITQFGYSPLDMARNAPSCRMSKDRKQKLIEILEREEKK